MRNQEHIAIGILFGCGGELPIQPRERFRRRRIARFDLNRKKVIIPVNNVTVPRRNTRFIRVVPEIPVVKIRPLAKYIRKHFDKRSNRRVVSKSVVISERVQHGGIGNIYFAFQNPLKFQDLFRIFRRVDLIGHIAAE